MLINVNIGQRLLTFGFKEGDTISELQNEVKKYLQEIEGQVNPRPIAYFVVAERIVSSSTLLTDLIDKGPAIAHFHNKKRDQLPVPALIQPINVHQMNALIRQADPVIPAPLPVIQQVPAIVIPPKPVTMKKRKYDESNPRKCSGCQHPTKGHKKGVTGCKSVCDLCPNHECAKYDNGVLKASVKKPAQKKTKVDELTDMMVYLTDQITKLRPPVPGT
jgi:hypothetical protein